MKRIITMQDISCVGKCALTVAIPIISSYGIEVCPLPTALLSNHTAFKEFEYFDLSEQVKKIIDSFIRQDFSFDGIYTGYLGSAAQVELAHTLIDEFKKEGTAVLIDPVMGDNGKLYSGIDDTFPEKMKELVKKADIIVPNLTEAGFLLGLNRSLNESDSIPDALKELSALGPDTVILTGYSEGNKTGAICYQKKSDEYFISLTRRIDRLFHGTGDIFASVLFAQIINGHSVNDALNKAVEFTYSAMKKTVENDSARWYGVDFESILCSK